MCLYLLFTTPPPPLLLLFLFSLGSALYIITSLSWSTLLLWSHWHQDLTSLGMFRMRWDGLFMLFSRVKFPLGTALHTPYLNLPPSLGEAVMQPGSVTVPNIGSSRGGHTIQKCPSEPWHVLKSNVRERSRALLYPESKNKKTEICIDSQLPFSLCSRHPWQNPEMTDTEVARIV